METFWHIHNFDWLDELSPAETARLRRQAAHREHAAGEMIFTPTPNPRCVYLLERGLVRIYRISDTGTETTFGYVRPGEIFGELAVFSSWPRESYARAVRTSLVWRLPREAIREVLASHPGIGLAITTQVGSRMKRIESRVETLVFRSVPSRVAGMLVELAEDFGRRDGHGIVIDLTISQEELGTLVGASRQAVNVSLRELERDHILRRRGRRIVLFDVDRLRRAIGSNAWSGTADRRRTAAGRPGPSSRPSR